jgi:hypothetical protein
LSTLRMGSTRKRGVVGAAAPLWHREYLITNLLPDLPEGSAERQAAHINLRNIRTVLARRDFSP